MCNLCQTSSFKSLECVGIGKRGLFLEKVFFFRNVPFWGVSPHLSVGKKFLRFCLVLGGRFGYFLFFLLGEGEGGAQAPGGGGGSVFIENPTREGGGFSRTGGAEGLGGCLRRIRGFLRGGGG